MAKLRLGRLPDRSTVKLTLTISTELKGLLIQYTELYESVYGAKEKTEDLIPAMLEAFIDADMGFKRARKKQENEIKNLSARHDRQDSAPSQ